MMAVRYHNRSVCILKERISTVAVMAPAAAECIEIFHQKLIIDRMMETTEVANMNDLIKNGI